MPPPAPAPPPRLLLLCGKDEELREICLKDLRLRFTGPLEWERMDSRQTSLAQLISQAISPLLFSAHRVIVASHADRLLKRPSPRKDAKGPACGDAAVQDNAPAALLQRFERAKGVQTTLVLLTTLPMREARALGAGTALSCWPLQDRDGFPELSRWTADRARSLGKILDAEASAALLERTGNSPGQILGALEALSLLAGSAQRISAASVEALVGSSPRHEPFRLADLICTGDSRAALAMLRGLTAAGERPEALCATLSFQFRRLMKGKCLIEGGAGPDQAAGSVGLPFSAAASATAAWRRLGAGTLDAALAELRDAERSLKSGGGRGLAAMERAVVRLCVLAAQGPRALSSRTR